MSAIESLSQLNKVRRVVTSGELAVLTDIYQEDVNMVVWRRQLCDTFSVAVDDFLKSNPRFQSAMSVTPQSAYASLRDVLVGAPCQLELSENIAELVDIFCCLFDIKQAGLRLAALSQAMCPRFHVDHVPCRLVSTYQGVATDWLAHESVDRTKLGKGSEGLSDEVSGLFRCSDDIKQLDVGDVALLKGERWEGNEGAGLVHRSPHVSANTSRLLLTLDVMS